MLRFTEKFGNKEPGVSSPENDQIPLRFRSTIAQSKSLLNKRRLKL